uniref:Integrase, catalytic region, zinc finger, CCHC-type, peptidase aspartic, catalytic n=1 Tax=Tanacetum cinerariifolium TaxID=118510 RepID=A0A6L2M338_TANCI|nr:integrase, catalytic region, zinc finger, CCHC-type, peptidase aspartic, catalytic [Tanacetum cinerariifolium]
MENYKNILQDTRDQLNAEAEAVQIILIGIDNDIYSTVDACPNACEMWKAIKRLKQGKSINVQDLETDLYWDFENSHHGMNKVNEIRAERLARIANPLALVAQQQPVYHPQNHPNHPTQYSTIRSQQATRNQGKSIANSSAPIYAQEPTTITKDDEIANQDNYLRINRGTGYDNQRVVNVAEAKENVAYHKEKMLLCKKEESGVQLNAEQDDWKDDTNNEFDDQELKAHYMYMAQIQEVTPDPVDNSRPIFNVEPSHKLVEIILFIVDSGFSKHMTCNLKLLTNFVEKFLGTVKFGIDQIAPILGYGDSVQGTITIKMVYYVEGLNHNLFSVGQFCDADLEVAF